ncbi:MAG: FAD-dependent oxidoreductase [Bacteroidales bacterium]|nr:FAD-dependent oxidoreductase [Bacteroidales bacterium]
MKNNVVIIGGGPSGIEAARQIRKIGYTPILIEKKPNLGGHLAKWDRLFPEGVYAKDILDSITSDMDDINWFTNTEIISINHIKEIYNIKLSNGISIRTKAVLLTTGFELFKAEKKEEYGYGIYDHVITNEDLEKFFKEHKDKRIEDPKVIGFVHCVGSRDEKAGNRQCSKVCCATAVKQACEIKQLFPDAIVYCFYMDLRMFGRKYEDMYLDAQQKYGIRFIRGRVSEVSENIDKRLIIKAEDTLYGKPLRVTMDLLVLMSGIVADQKNIELAKMLKIPVGEDGFFVPQNSILEPCKSQKNGLFFAGACTGPKTIPESISEARAATLSIDEYLKNFKE